MEPRTSITALLVAAREGNHEAERLVFSLVYGDLRAIAHRQLNPGNHGRTLDTTALVHEAYLKLARHDSFSAVDRRHLLATAARAMRQVVVDAARAHRTARRGGGARHVAFTDGDRGLQGTGWSAIDLEHQADEIFAIDAGITHLADLDARLARVVELRFFGGLSIEEVGEVMKVSPRTVKRLWQTARAVLYRELAEP